MKRITPNGREENVSESAIESVHKLYWAAWRALDVLNTGGDYAKHNLPATIKELRSAVRSADKAQTLSVIL